MVSSFVRARLSLTLSRLCANHFAKHLSKLIWADTNTLWELTMADAELELKNAIEAANKFQSLMEGVLPTLLLGVESFADTSSNPNVAASKPNSLHILKGALIVYLFSMWDTFFDSNTPENYFRDEEKLMYYAFKHIRHVAAHNIDGDRHGNQDQDRMKHADKLDALMDSENKISGLVLEEYTLDLGHSDVVLDCRQFMQKMAMLLAGGRLSVGAPHGKIKCVGPDGTGTTDVM